MSIPRSDDAEVVAVAAEIRQLDPNGSRTAQVLRDTLDQLYDGQHTGRYSPAQLYKTEKTHCGTIVEINIQREFRFSDGNQLDYQIQGVDVDCKYSQSLGGWMIPPEAHGKLCLLLSADDFTSHWSMGLVRVTPDRLNPGANRDAKVTLNHIGREAVLWLFDRSPLPPNVLLKLSPETVAQIMALPSGARRINELFRNTLGMRIGRGVVSTVAQQDDYMKRVRANGGARTALKPEGIVILGQYESHRAVARALGIPEPDRGESVAARLVPAAALGAGVAEIRGRLWRLAKKNDPVVRAPQLPSR